MEEENTTASTPDIQPVNVEQVQWKSSLVQIRTSAKYATHVPTEWEQTSSTFASIVVHKGHCK